MPNNIKHLQVFGDSEIVIKQVRNTMHCLSGHLKHYQSLVQDLTFQFTMFNISPIPRLQKTSADLLANVASKLIPPKYYSPDRFSIELIFTPFIPNNITNWRVFNNDPDIIRFLTSKGSYDDQIVDEDQHDNQLKQETANNYIPKSIFNLEDLYDLPTNSKLQSSTLRFELIDLGTDLKPQNINIGLGLTSDEKSTFIRLLKRYKNVFAWNYEDLKTYDTSVIQHTIPMTSDEKPVHRKLRKFHPNLEN